MARVIDLDISPIIDLIRNYVRENIMALADDALVELTGAIDEVSGELDAIAAQLAAALSDPNPVFDANIATQISAMAARLRALRP